MATQAEQIDKMVVKLDGVSTDMIRFNLLQSQSIEKIDKMDVKQDKYVNYQKELHTRVTSLEGTREMRIEAKKKSKEKREKFIGAVCLVVIAAALGGYFTNSFSKNTKVNNDTSKPVVEDKWEVGYHTRSLRMDHNNTVDSFCLEPFDEGFMIWEN